MGMEALPVQQLGMGGEPVLGEETLHAHVGTVRQTPVYRGQEAGRLACDRPPAVRTLLRERRGGAPRAAAGEVFYLRRQLNTRNDCGKDPDVT
eukprot:scaffold30036_cov37-Phaeocystis_antarctica.AAC.1